MGSGDFLDQSTTPGSLVKYGDDRRYEYEPCLRERRWGRRCKTAVVEDKLSLRRADPRRAERRKAKFPSHVPRHEVEPTRGTHAAGLERSRHAFRSQSRPSSRPERLTTQRPTVSTVRWVPKGIEQQPQSTSLPSTITTTPSPLLWRPSIVKDAETGEPLELRPRNWEFLLPESLRKISFEKMNSKCEKDASLNVPLWRHENAKNSGGGTRKGVVAWQTLGGTITREENSQLESSVSPVEREGYWLVDDRNQWKEVHAEGNKGAGYPHRFARGTISDTSLLARKSEGYDEPETPRPTERLHSPVGICPPPPESHMIDRVGKWAIHAMARERLGSTPYRQRCPSGWETRVNCHRRGNNRPLRSAVQGFPEGQRRPQSSLLLMRSLTRGTAQKEPQDRKALADKSRTVRPSTFPEAPALGTRTINDPEGKLDYESARRRWLSLDKTTDSHSGKAIFSNTVPDDVRFNMLYIQEVRDRYLRQAYDMLMEENREEHRREAALRRGAADPQQVKYLQLRYKREREVKRAMITRITRDSQLIMIQKAAELGLVR